MPLYLSSVATSTTQLKARCMVPIIQMTFGRMFTTFRWLTFSANTNNGHVRRIKVSYLFPHTYYVLTIDCPVDLNERDSLEAVRKQVRKYIVRGLGMWQHS